MDNNIDNSEYLEVLTSRAMVYIPDNTVELELLATIYEGGEIKRVRTILGLHEVQNALRDAFENYSEPDDRYVLTDLGRELLNKNESGVDDTPLEGGD